MSIVTEAMVANMQIGMWTGQRQDKQASAALTDEANAAADAARVNKHLVPKEDLKPVVTAMGALRTHFYEHTLPWKDNGDRLLTRRGYTTFMSKFNDLKRAFDDAVDTFLTETYTTVRARAEFRMGDLFNPADYPPASALRNRFYVSIDIDGITDAGDFRVKMDANAVAEAKQSIERAMQERVNRAVGDIWARLSTTIGHFAKKMSSDEVFRNSTVQNLEELVELLPALNFTGDPELERIRLEVKQHLTGHTPDELRKNEDVRKSVGAEAQRIMDDMAGFMAAFGGAK